MIFNMVGGGGTSNGVKSIDIPELKSGQYSFQVDLGISFTEIESVITNVAYYSEYSGYVLIKAGIYDSIRIFDRYFNSQLDYLKVSNVSGTIYKFTANSESDNYIKYFSGKKMFLLLK